MSDKYAVCLEHGILKPCMHCEPPEDRYSVATTKPPPEAKPQYIVLCVAAGLGDVLVLCNCGRYRPWWKNCGSLVP